MALLARQAATVANRVPDFGNYNPLTAIKWECALWADDPLQLKPAVGSFTTGWRNASNRSVGVRDNWTGTGVYASNNGRMNGRGSITFNQALGTQEYTGPTTTIPVPLYTIVNIAYTPTLANTDSVGAYPLGSAWASGTHWGVNIQTSGASNRRWALSAGGGAGYATPVADTVPHLWRLYPASTSTLNAIIDETYLLGGNSASPITQMVLNRYGNTSGNGNSCHAFVGVYRNRDQWVKNITTDPGWNTFKAWARAYYGLKI